MSNFKRMTKRQLPYIVNLIGGEDSGKTDLACDFPEPIFFHDFELNAEPVIVYRYPEKDIRVASYHYEIPTEIAALATQIARLEGKEAEKNKAKMQRKAEFKQKTDYIKELCSPIWNQFMEDYREGVQIASQESGTIVVDTGDRGWMLLRLARFGTGTEILPSEYTPVNAEWRQIWNIAKVHGVNLVMCHSMKDEYDKEGNATGAKVGDMQNKVMHDCHFSFRLNQKKGEFFAKVEKWKGPKGKEMKGKVIPNLRFETLQKLVQGETINA